MKYIILLVVIWDGDIDVEFGPEFSTLERCEYAKKKLATKQKPLAVPGREGFIQYTADCIQIWRGDDD